MNADSQATIYPYARVKGLKDFMLFAREPEWKPSQINAELFKKLSLAKGKEREAVKALRFLGLIDEAGTPTSEFDALKTDYQSTMARLVRHKYSELFSLIPPRMANQERLVKFFDKSLDTSEYQAKLFSWFCEQAGIELPNLEKHFHRAHNSKNENPELSE